MLSDDKLEEQIEEQADSTASNEPLEVKIIEKKVIVTEEEPDYVDMDITTEEIEEFENGTS